jgi:hypothetical protein
LNVRSPPGIAVSRISGWANHLKADRLILDGKADRQKPPDCVEKLRQRLDLANAAQSCSNARHTFAIRLRFHTFS